MNMHYGQLDLVEVDVADPSDEEQARLGRIDALDRAHRAIDALGGYYDRNNPGDRAYDEALSELIQHIEDLGGMDPGQRQRMENAA